MAASKLARCTRCTRLFAETPDEDGLLCETCHERRLGCLELIREAIVRWNLHDIQDIASFAGLSLRDTEEALKSNPQLAGKLDEHPRCKKCHKEPAQEGSDYCLPCRLMLNKAIGAALRETTHHVEEITQRHKEMNSRARLEVDKLLGSKRHSTRSGRGGFSPKNRWSG